MSWCATCCWKSRGRTRRGEPPLVRERRSGQTTSRDLRVTGIGGPSDPSKASCLHAYAAALLATREGWLPVVPGVDAMWERLGLPTTAMWCEDDRCSERARQSTQAEVT